MNPSAQLNPELDPELDPERALSEVNTLLEQFAHFGVELGLERIERLLTALGNPERQVPIVHIAGSNGKGSVCAYLSAVLTAAGYRVGRYTSPHLVSWCERVCLNQQEISAIELRALLLQVIAAIDPDQSSPTQFEVITAVAWLYFAQQQVDIAIVEVGLGGRLDATNVCDQPLVSIITSLSLEHWQRLGPTLADISREKAGILKPNRPAIIAPQPPEAEAVLQERLSQLNCPAHWVKPAKSLGNGWAESQNPKFSYPLPLLGQHQLINSALALAALQTLRQQGWQISDAQIIEGMAQTQWPGRLQWLQWQQRPLLIDGAHNPAGAAMLRNYLDRNSRTNHSGCAAQVTQPIHWVIGMIGTKDHADIFRALLRPDDSLFLVPVPEHLPTDLEKLATIAVATCPQLTDCQIYEDVISAIEQAQTYSSGTTVLCGSLYLIGHFLRLGSTLFPVKN
jgi:dihydrofolate synthase / folylpolyglutamate synthase